MPNILKLKHTKRFISGSIAGLFLLLQLPLFLLATPSAFADHGTGTSGDSVCPAGSVLIAKFEFQGNKFKAESGGDNISIAPDSTATSGSFTVIKEGVTVSSFIIKAGNHSETTTLTLPLTNGQTGTFNNDSDAFTNKNGNAQAAISNIQFCGSVVQAVTGTVTINKVAPTAIDNEQFGFTSDLTGTGNDAFTLGNGGSKTVANLALNETFTVTEDLFEGFNLTNLTCTEGGSANISTRTATITLTEENTDVTCTFTNTKPNVLGDATGSITIVKSAPDATNEQFGFTTSANTGNENSAFKLGDSDSKQIIKLNLNETYTVTESLFEGFTLTGLVCSEGGNGDLATRTATIIPTILVRDVTCTFTNTKNVDQPPVTGTLNITKSAPSADAEQFVFTSDVPGAGNDLFTLGKGQTKSFTSLDLNTPFTVTESEFPLFTLTNLVCTPGATSTVDLEARTATVTLTDANREATCTFTNTKGAVLGDTTGSLTIIKSAPTAAGEQFGFTSTNTGSANSEFSLGKGEKKVITPLTLNQTYTVTESVFAGFNLTDLTCSAGGSGDLATRTATVELTLDNKDVTCTFTNTKIVGGVGGDNGGTGGENVTNNGGRVLGASTVVIKPSPVISLFTPQVLGASTTGPNKNQQLVNTGSTMFMNIFAGLFVIGIVGALTATQRRQYS